MEFEEHHVFFTAGPGATLPEAMAQLGPWLARNAIKPIAFNHTITPSGEIEVQLTFGTRHEASLFERAFCDADNLA
ncbi:MAG TPA: hypothetical protein VGG57_00760 [Stellaceae bacterium]|jgi:hypothetical protein